MLNSLANPPSEEKFFQLLCGRTDPALVTWAINYHYFSTHQAKLLAIVVQALSTVDYRSLSEVTKALFEEYGSGSQDQVHSRLFARFCVAIGIDPAVLPVKRNQVLQPVLDYLDCIKSAYSSEDLAVMLGAYCFLERSAVLSYPLMLRTFRSMGFGEDELIFFSTHVLQEAEHDSGASCMAERLIVTPHNREMFRIRVRHMQRLWADFWHAFDTTPGTDARLTHRLSSMLDQHIVQ